MDDLNPRVWLGNNLRPRHPGSIIAVAPIAPRNLLTIRREERCDPWVSGIACIGIVTPRRQGPFVIFTSDVFLLLFLPIVFTIYWLLGRRRPQNLLLVIASYFFYGWWDYRFCFLLWLASTSDFLIAQAMDRARDLRHRKRLVWLSCLLNLSALGFFKYCNFFLESLSGALAFCGWPVDTWTLRILLPLGISFHTFQTLSYVIDVYRGRMPACRDYVTYLAFILVLPAACRRTDRTGVPHVAAVRARAGLRCPLAVLGLELFLWGLFKKIAIADNLAPFADQVFANPASSVAFPCCSGSSRSRSRSTATSPGTPKWREAWGFFRIRTDAEF